MNRWHVQFLLLSIIIVAVTAPCRGISDEEAVRLIDTNGVQKLTTDSFSYVVYSKAKRPCILANMSIKITVPYKMKKDKEEANSEANLVVSKDVYAYGTCSAIISEMKLTWLEPNAEKKNNTIKFTIINDHTNFSVFSIDLDIYPDEKNFPNAIDPKTPLKKTSKIDLRLFVASATNGIHNCSKDTKLEVEDAAIVMSNVSLIAFNTYKNISSRKEEICTDDKKESKTFPYVLKNEENQTCTMARMSISLGVLYQTKNFENKRGVINVPTNVNVTGFCDSTFTNMNLIWKESGSTSAQAAKANSIMFGFRNDSKNTLLYIVNVDILLDDKNFPDAVNVDKRLSMTMMGSNLFLASAENGMYSCVNETVIQTYSGNITISDVLLVAFDAQKEFSSKKVTDCRNILSENSFNYIVKNSDTGVPCILANMLIKINIANLTETVPKKVNLGGTCNSKRSEMQLSWPGLQNTTNRLVFYIARDATNFFVFQIEASINLDKDKVVNGTSEFGLNLFSAPVNNGFYNCTDRTEEVEFDDIHLTLTNVSFIAFNDEEDLNSKKVEDCSNKNSSTSTTESTTSNTESTNLTTSTIAPTVAPDPSVKRYNYVVMNPETQVPCIVANMSISMNIPYNTKDSKTEAVILKVPTTAATSGTCNDKESTMQLRWMLQNTYADSEYENEENMIGLTFKKDESKYSLSSIVVSIYMDEKHFLNAVDKKHDAATDKLNILSATPKNLYKCARENLVKAKDVSITISNVALIAFNTEKSVASRTEENCKSTEESTANVGLIVVLCLLGAAALTGITAFAVIKYRKRRMY